jgi:hypothetical protein
MLLLGASIGLLVQLAVGRRRGSIAPSRTAGGDR